MLQQETSFNYVDTVRSYGSAADELESLPPTRLTSHDYIQSIQKPMAAVAPSVINGKLIPIKIHFKAFISHIQTKKSILSFEVLCKPVFPLHLLISRRIFINNDIVFSP